MGGSDEMMKAVNTAYDTLKVNQLIVIHHTIIL